MADQRPGGASAEYAVVGERAAARMPASLSAREAAAVPLAGLTALQALRDLGRIAADKRVLVVGAAGGVGHLAVQIARSYRADVTAVCSGRHADMMRALGVNRMIDYTTRSDFSGPHSYDLVLDLVVRSPVRAFFPLMAKDGICVSVLPSFDRIVAGILLPLCSRRRVRVVSVKPRGEDLDHLRALSDAGKLKPVIDRVFRLDELAAAHAYSQLGRTSGKIVVIVGD